MKKISLLIAFLFVSCYMYATLNVGKGQNARYMINITENGKKTSAPASDFYFVVERIGKADSLDINYVQAGTGMKVMTVKSLGPHLVVDFNFEGFKEPVDGTIESIKITLLQKSTGIVCTKTINAPLSSSGTKYYTNLGEGFELTTGTIPSTLGISVSDLAMCEGETGKVFIAVLTNASASASVAWPNGITGSGTNKMTGTINPASFPATGSPYNLTAILTDGVDSKTANFKLTVNKKITVDISAGSFCYENQNNGGSGTYTITATTTGGDAPYTYTWTKPAAILVSSSLTGTVNSIANIQNLVISNANTLAVGDYTGISLTVEGAGGCSATSSKKLTVNALPNVTLTGLDAVCEGDANVVATVTGTGTYTYSWELPTSGGVANSLTYKPLTAGSVPFKVVVSDAGSKCSKELTGDLAINPKPKVSLNTSVSAGCVGEALTLTASASDGDNNYTYSWTGKGTPTTLTTDNSVNMQIQAGTENYTVKVTDGKECTATSTGKAVTGREVIVRASTIPASVVNGGKANLDCTVEVKPTGSIASYSWTPQNMIEGGFANSTKKNPVTVALTAAQKYTVEVEDDLGCKGNDEVTVNVTGNVLAVNAVGGACCEGTELSLDCTPSGGQGDGDPDKYTYSWVTENGLILSSTKVQHPQIALSTPPGSYRASVTIHDGLGSVTSEKVDIIVYTNPIVTLKVEPNKGCAGDALKLTASATDGDASAYSYVWSGKGAPGVATTNDFVDITVQAGIQDYTVKVTDGKGCSAISAIQPVEGRDVKVMASATPTSVVNGGKSRLNCAVTVVPAGSVNSYQWTPQNMIEGGAANDKVQNPWTVALNTQQKYDIEVTDDLGCRGKASITIDVSGTQLAVTATGGTECYGKTLTLGCTPSGGAGDGVPKDYDYLWTPSAGLVLSNTKIQNPIVDATTVPGSYTASVTITDGINSVTSADVTVIVKEQPILTNILATPASGLNSVTAALTVAVTPSTALLAWTPADKIASGVTTNNATTQLLTASQQFTVTASLDGCFDEKTVDVTVANQDMTVTAAGSSGCADSKLTVEANASGGAPAASGYEYKWGNSTPAGVVLSSTTVKKPTIQNSASLKPGAYSIPVTVTDSKGQSKTANAAVTVYGVVQALGAGLCKDATTFDGQITLSNGELPYTIYSDAGATTVVGDAIWNADQTVATIENLQSGTVYSYYIKDKNACNIARVDLEADCACGAQLVMTQGAKVCALSGDDITVTLLASGGTSYSFDLVNVELGTKVLEVKNETKSMWEHKVKYADRGKYRVDNFVAITLNSPTGCDGNVVPKNGVDVQFFPTPRVDGGADQKVCGDGMITLKANGDAGLIYTWDNNVTDGVAFTPTMGQSTVYTVKGTDGNGCWKEDQVEVTANLKPTVAAMATPNTVCRGEVVTLSHNGTADVYVWDNGGQTGANNIPETTTRYTVTGTSNATGCSDTSSALVVVNLPAEIIEKPKDRTIAIGKNVTYKVKAIGNNLTYQWQWYNSSTQVWMAFTDNTATSPKVSGAKTESLLLEEVPQAWDGRKVKCVVQGDCGAPVEAEANLWVKECFDIVADLKMGDGIRPDGTPGSAVDGWYCKGTRISLKALVALADPENGVVVNPHYVWTIDGLPAAKVIESDSSVLSWVPEYYEDDIVVRVCVYSDGACNEACSRYLRLKARTPDDVKMQIVTSIDPDRMFCPGESVDVTVALKNGGNNSNIHWYRDIFDKGTGLKKTFVMDQKDTWVRAVFEPSPDLCVEKVISDSVFLRVKEYVQPTLRIENNINDTIACQGDTLLFRAIWSDAGEKPQLAWQQDIWNRGTGEYALIGLTDKDTWVKCTLTPGNDVCFSGVSVVDTMVIRVRELSSLTIATDLTDKQPGDELLFTSVIEGVNRNWNYNWYVNGNQTTCVEDFYTTDLLRQGDVVDASISGEKVCQTKVFSNKIQINYVGAVSRDTMLVIYEGERIKDLDMLKEGDDIRTVLFRVDIPATYGMASFSPDGKFNYIPNSGFLGTDYVKYVIINKQTKEVIAEGYIYITVKDSERFLVPNLITPNDDGLNDTWKLDFLVNYPNHFIQVFDRNGNVVFEGRNYQNDWKGEGFTKGGYVGHVNLVNGVYTYVIDLGDKDKTILKSWIEIRANLNRRNYR